MRTEKEIFLDYLDDMTHDLYQPELTEFLHDLCIRFDISQTDFEAFVEEYYNK